MAEPVKISLADVGDVVFRALQQYVSRNGTDRRVEVTIASGDLQESLFVRLADTTTLLLKIFPHRNFMDKAVYRIEMYRTRPGDPRGNRIAFVEIPKGDDMTEEVRLFLEGVLGQCDL